MGASSIDTSGGGSRFILLTWLLGLELFPFWWQHFLLPNGTRDSHMHAVNWPGTTLQKKIGCFNHWVVTLVARDSGKEKFILVLEVNCISNLVQIVPYNWQPSEHLWVTTKKKKIRFLSWGYYIYMLFDVHASVTSFNDAWSVVAISTRSSCRRSGKLPLWLSYAISKIHNT